ncbi:MAG: SIS domain-containing protein [Candidatus Hodarchaeales archaeon]|jgi:glucosamine--fructose-6-phosphate aminotransferase (isomerizing)
MSTNDYMSIEIQEQPELMRRLNSTSRSIKKTVLEVLEDTDDIDNIVLTGCGDSLCASMAMEQAFQEFTGSFCVGTRPMDVSRYSKVIFDDKTIVIPISVSGKTPRVIEVVHKAKAAGSKVIAITDNPSSPLNSLSDVSVLIKASPPESLSESSYTNGDAVKYIGYQHDVAQTKTYTQGLLALAWIAISIGEIKGYLSERILKEKANWLNKIPTMVKKVLRREQEIKLLAEKLLQAPYFIYTGSGPNYATACYSAFKHYEYSIPAFYNELEEYCHSHYFITEGGKTPVVLIAQGKSLERASEIIPVIEKTIKTKTWLITSEDQVDFTNSIFQVPALPEELSPIVTVIPLQLFIYNVAKRWNGVDINKFRGGKDTELYVSGSYHTIRKSRIKKDFFYKIDK